jgi:WD40 repeat protein
VAVSRILSTGNNQSAGSPTIEVLGLLERSPGGVTAMAFSPNGQVLATGDRSGRINLWDAASFTWFGVLEGHERNKALLDLAWSPDGDQLLSGGKDGKVILWDVLTFEPLYQIAGPAGALSLSYSPDGLSFAAANGEGEIVIHQSAEPFQEESAQTLNRDLAGLTYSSGWSNIAAFTPTGELSLWPLAGDPVSEPIISLTGHGASIAAATAQAYSPDGQFLATALDDQVILWDTTTWKPLQFLSGHESGVTDLAWSPDGSELASASRDQSVIVWDLESGQPRLHLVEHTRNVTDLAFAPDGRRLATAGSLDDTVIIWDLEDGQSLGRFPGEGDGVWSVGWSPDGQTLAVGLTSGHIQLWAVDDPAEAGPLTTMIRHAGWVSGLAYSPDGSLLASVGADGRLLITRLEDEKAKTYAGYLGPIRRVHFSPDGAFLATAGIDGKSIIWDASPDASTEPLAIFEGHTDSINDAGWSPDGKQLVSVSDDGTAIVWDISTGP